MMHEDAARGSWRRLAMLALMVCMALVLAAAPALAEDAVHDLPQEDEQLVDLSEEDLGELVPSPDLDEPSDGAELGTIVEGGAEEVDEDEMADEGQPILYEGGKSAGSAQSISVNSWVTDRMTSSNSSNVGYGTYATWYRFSLQSPGWVRLEFLSDYADQYEGWSYRMYSTSDTSHSLVNPSVPGFQPSKLTTQYGYKLGLPAGTYYLRLQAEWLERVSNLNYRFRVAYTKSSAWEKEPNNNAGVASPISLNTTYNGSNTNHSIGGNGDWYRFTLKAKTSIGITFGGDYRSNASWRLRLQNQNQVGSSSTLIYTTIDTKKLVNDIRAESITLPAGTYYLCVDDSNATYGLNYHFRVDAVDDTPVYRLYNKKTSEHLYTINYGEFRDLPTITKGDWVQEGIAWYAPKKSNTPVYRLYNKKSGDHHYTTSKAEADALVANHGWTLETTAFYSDDAKRVPLYRLYNGRLQRGQHHYTADANERKGLTTRFGWKYEAIGFYGVKTK